MRNLWTTGAKGYLRTFREVFNAMFTRGYWSSNANLLSRFAWNRIVCNFYPMQLPRPLWFYQIIYFRSLSYNVECLDSAGAKLDVSVLKSKYMLEQEFRKEYQTPLISCVGEWNPTEYIPNVYVPCSCALLHRLGRWMFWKNPAGSLFFLGGGRCRKGQNINDWKREKVTSRATRSLTIGNNISHWCFTPVVDIDGLS